METADSRHAGATSASYAFAEALKKSAQRMQQETRDQSVEVALQGAGAEGDAGRRRGRSNMPGDSAPSPTMVYYLWMVHPAIVPAIGTSASGTQAGNAGWICGPPQPQVY